MFDKLIALVGAAVLFCMLVIAFGLLLAFPTMWLWNGLCPELFGLKPVSLMQAWGLLVLCGLLFKNDTSSKD